MLKSEMISTEVMKSFVGDSSIVRKVLLTLLAGGHVLLEDIPGVGKTTLAVAFSKALDLMCKRVQFTPDIMPSDVTGYSMLRRDTQEMEYKPGAAMCNFLLADEINRATARSQSALLEAMEENSVTVDGVTYALPQPFMVVATQNPSGSSGTQLLPESQTDRFMVRVSIGYPSYRDEIEMLARKHGERAGQPVMRVTDAQELLEMRQIVSNVYLSDEIYEYVVSLVRATREHAQIQQGASPRCSAALMSLSQASAFCAGRDYVVPEDVQGVYVDCTSHRLILSQQSKREGVKPESILNEILRNSQVPNLRPLLKVKR